MGIEWHRGKYSVNEARKNHVFPCPLANRLRVRETCFSCGRLWPVTCCYWTLLTWVAHVSQDFIVKRNMCSSRDKMIRREFCWHFGLHICRHPRVAEYSLPVSSWLCPIDVHMMKFAHRHVWMCFPFLRPSEVPGAWFHAVAAVALRRVAQGVRWQPESFARMAFGTRWFS